MSFLTNPRGYTAAEFDAYVKTLHWGAWKPKFLVLHNTAEPNLRQWANGNRSNKPTVDYEHQRILNLNSYYKGMGWHSGPHLFVSPTYIWDACDLAADGVHVSCWNHVCIGIEMVGDYGVEAFDSGDGAKVRDLTVAALASLHKALGLRPDGYRVGESGLHFHKECVRDHHDCPGKHVDKADVVARVLAAMRYPGGVTTPAPKAPPVFAQKAPAAPTATGGLGATTGHAALKS